MAPESKILVERRGATAVLTLDSPPLNILELSLLAQLADALERLAADTDPPHVLVVRGAGERAFSAGASVPDHVPERVAEMLSRFHRAILTLRELPCVTIARIQGHCLGGGLELAAACDLAVASENATFSQPEIDLACFPPVASALYPSQIGAKRAAELVLLGGRFDARRALEMGLVNEVVPDGELDAAVARWTEALAAKSRAALAIAKRSLAIGASRPPREAVAACERLYVEELVPTHDMAEGIAAFLAKRKPRWLGR